MVLGKLSVLGGPTNLINVGQGPIALAVSAGGVVWTFFSLFYLFSFLSPSLGDGLTYTEILFQRAIKPKNNQPTNQPTNKLSKDKVPLLSCKLLCLLNLILWKVANMEYLKVKSTIFFFASLSIRGQLLKERTGSDSILKE